MSPCSRPAACNLCKLTPASCPSASFRAASGAFGSVRRSKREFAAEIAATLAFSAARSSDKVGLLLFTDQMELFLPPRKGRRHILRIMREMLAFEPHARARIFRAHWPFLITSLNG